MRAMLNLADREEISRGLAEGLEYKQIGVLIGRNLSVVSREVARHGGRIGYRAATADTAAGVSRRRPKTWAVQRVPGLREVVRERLRLGWSPASIAGRLPFDYPDDQAYRVSHEAVYQWVYAQPVSTLARELIGLRTGRTARRGGARPAPAPRIREPRYLDERPAEVEGRQVPGHWEGDLVIGKGGKSAVATLVERTFRFVVLVPLTGRDSLTVGDAVIAAAGTLPPQLARSLIWDCGSEMAGHARITAAGLPVYFARPHSPWQRGSNENANRILREYFPKGVPITSDPKYLAMVASEINDRPRKIHGWKKPSEIFTRTRRGKCFHRLNPPWTSRPRVGPRCTSRSVANASRHVRTTSQDLRDRSIWSTSLSALGVFEEAERSRCETVVLSER